MLSACHHVNKINEGVNRSAGTIITSSIPTKKKPQNKCETQLDDFDNCDVRRIGKKFHVTEGVRPLPVTPNLYTWTQVP